MGHDRHHDEGQSGGPRTVLVASPELLAAWSSRSTPTGDLISFTDGDSQIALDTITRRRPQIVVLEQLFAATARGAAFVQMLQNDPMLAGLDIRILSPERTATLLSSQSSTGSAAVSVAALAHPLQHRPLRRAVRVKLPDGVEALVDGNQATIIDLSVIGAQVVSPTILRPNQRVRVLLPELIRINAGIAWAAFEMPRQTDPYYRAGIEFTDADPQALEEFYCRLQMAAAGGERSRSGR